MRVDVANVAANHMDRQHIAGNNSHGEAAVERSVEGDGRRITSIAIFPASFQIARFCVLTVTPRLARSDVLTCTEAKQFGP